jgi:hypothetical protein
VGPGGVGIGYDPPVYARGGLDGLYVNGRVGIGTTNPSSGGGANSLGGALLDVYATGTGVSSNVNISAGCDGSPSTANKASIIFNTKGAGGGIVNGGITHQYFTAGSGTYGFNFQPFGLVSSVMSILGSGNVGIGTTNPGYPLFVNYTNSSGGVNETGIYINNTAKTNSSQMSLGGGNVYSVIAQGSFGLPSNGFSIYNTTKSSSPFNITSAGGVGIGAVSPETPLDVTTTFASTGLTNSSTLWLGALTNLSGATSGANYTGSTYHAGDNNSQSLLIYAGGVYPNGAGIIQSKDTLGVRNYGQRLLLNPDGGFVGIGTTNPGGLLQIGSGGTCFTTAQNTNTKTAFDAGINIISGVGYYSGFLQVHVNYSGYDRTVALLYHYCACKNSTGGNIVVNATLLNSAVTTSGEFNATCTFTPVNGTTFNIRLQTSGTRAGSGTVAYNATINGIPG